MTKRMISIVLSCAMVMSLLTFSVAAAEPAYNVEDDGIGEIVSFNIIEAAPSGTTMRSSESETNREAVIAYMEAQGWIPGSIFYIGNKKYEVLDDYQIMYLGVDEDRIVHHMADSDISTRATTIPTVRGELPYDGTYSIKNYMYTSHYWLIGGDEYTRASIGVLVSPDSEQTVRVDWINGATNLSIGYKTFPVKPNNIYQYVWVYGDKPFYLTLRNQGSYGQERITGAFHIYVDLVEDWYE